MDGNLEICANASFLHVVVSKYMHGSLYWNVIDCSAHVSAQISQVIIKKLYTKYLGISLYEK